MPFKHRLKRAREAAGLSQEFVAKALGVTRQAVGNWENEKSPSTPDPERLAEMASMYDVSVDYLLGVRRKKKADPHDNTPIERRMVRMGAETGDLSGWSEEQLRQLEIQIRIAKQVIMEEAKAKEARTQGDHK